MLGSYSTAVGFYIASLSYSPIFHFYEIGTLGFIFLRVQFYGLKAAFEELAGIIGNLFQEVGESKKFFLLRQVEASIHQLFNDGLDRGIMYHEDVEPREQLVQLLIG